MAPLLLAGLGAGVSGLGSLFGGAIGGSSAEEAARIQAAAADRASEQLRQYYGQAQAMQTPYQAAGQVGLGQLTGQDYTVPVSQFAYGQQAPTPYAGQPFDYSQNADPGAQFRMQQGQQAIMGSAAAGGAGLSGATLKALTRFQGLLDSQTYQQAFQRYMAGRQQGQAEQGQRYGQYAGERESARQSDTDYYNRLMQQQQQRYGQASQLAGLGQTATGQMTNMATGLGQSLADITGQRGQALAAGAAGRGQAWGGMAGTLGGLGTMAMMPYLMQQMPKTTTVPTIPPTPTIPK